MRRIYLTVTILMQFIPYEKLVEYPIRQFRGRKSILGCISKILLFYFAVYHNGILRPFAVRVEHFDFIIIVAVLVHKWLPFVKKLCIVLSIIPQ